MSDVAMLAGILGALLVGAASPGPSFLFVARTSVAQSRRRGLAAALGMGVGGLVFGWLALTGLRALMGLPRLYAGLTTAGGCYLLLLAFRLWRAAKEPLVVAESGGEDARGERSCFVAGLSLQLSNPKTAVVYASVFGAALSPEPPRWMFFTLPPLVLLVEASWYSAVALAFSSGAPRTYYLGAKRWIDCTAAVFLGVLGARIVIGALAH